MCGRPHRKTYHKSNLYIPMFGSESPNSLIARDAFFFGSAPSAGSVQSPKHWPHLQPTLIAEEARTIAGRILQVGIKVPTNLD